MDPFVKWVGGKRQLLNELRSYIPHNFNTYYEPFIGRGAFFLDLLPKSAIISDSNFELINTWLCVRNNPNELIQLLEEHQSNNSKEYYYEIRGLDRTENFDKLSPIERAARFIYLNKAGFNGLWRVNKKGHFNVPYANPKTLNLTMEDKIQDISNYLNSNDIEILWQDYLEVRNKVEKNDFVYFDPPYIPITETSAFTSYTKEGFTLENQIELRNLAKDLAEKGTFVMLSNSGSEIIYDLYSDPIFNIHEVYAKRSINSKGDKRGNVKEVIITTY